MTKHTPATPLPWKVSGLGYLSNDNAVIAATDSVPNLGEGYRHVAITGLDAAYIVHTANNYQRLVEAAKSYAGACSLMAIRDAADPAMREGWSMAHANVNLLLRELGEAE